LTTSVLPRRRIAVLGAGVSGLTAAYKLAQARQAGAPIEELLIEASGRLGGVIHTEHVQGFVIEAGPDSFLEQKPEAAALCRELGLEEALIGSNDRERRTYILHRGRLVPLPDGLMLLVPTRLWPMVTTPLLPLHNKLGILREWFTPPCRNQHDDESVAGFVRRHFGDAMLENIADPLLAGVYGGDSSALSIRSVLPRFWEMERKHGSLTRATIKARRERLNANRKARGGQPPVPPLFMTLKGGLQQLTTKLAECLDPSRVRTGQRVVSIESSLGGAASAADTPSPRYQVVCEGGLTYDVDAVILALPAHECSQLLSRLAPGLSHLLATIPYSSSMTVSLAFAENVRAQLPPGFGYLVPRHEQRRMLACTFVHTKFPARAPGNKALLRCFLGGTRDPEVLGLSDAEVVLLVLKELWEILSLHTKPLFHRVYRWPRSMAQYTVGHTERLSALQKELENHFGLFLAGNAYSGIGISDCVRTGKAAAERALACTAPGWRESREKQIS
jgi:protoporphyrinogen/coproporphyrinogen III oxidase